MALRKAFAVTASSSGMRQQSNPAQTSAGRQQRGAKRIVVREQGRVRCAPRATQQAAGELVAISRIAAGLETLRIGERIAQAPSGLRRPGSAPRCLALMLVNHIARLDGSGHRACSSQAGISPTTLCSALSSDSALNRAAQQMPPVSKCNSNESRGSAESGHAMKAPIRFFNLFALCTLQRCALRRPAASPRRQHLGVRNWQGGLAHSARHSHARRTGRQDRMPLRNSYRIGHALKKVAAQAALPPWRRYARAYHPGCVIHTTCAVRCNNAAPCAQARACPWPCHRQCPPHHTARRHGRHCRKAASPRLGLRKSPFFGACAASTDAHRCSWGHRRHQHHQQVQACDAAAANPGFESKFASSLLLAMYSIRHSQELSRSFGATLVVIVTIVMNMMLTRARPRSPGAA
ncbi:hypothetical protein FQR65_LT20434 [Abscondita terminalis]|nr:hypothetical protein FQR65_LT20434 [Abscondita terminalis]